MINIIYRNSTSPTGSNRDITNLNIRYDPHGPLALDEHIVNTTSYVNANIMHTYGNVTSQLKHWLENNLKSWGSFRTVRMATTVAHRQVRSRPNMRQKIDFPSMIIVPRITFGQSENRFLANTLLAERRNNIHATWGDGSMIPLALDKKRRLMIHGRYNRAVLYLDVILTFETFSEQGSMANFIYNALAVGHNQFLHSPLELHLPKSMCHLIGSLAGFSNIDDDIPGFLGYMNSIFELPITHQLKSGSNNDEFFMYYTTDIDTVILNEITIGQGKKDGQSKSGFDISFTVRCDFNTVGQFALQSPEMKERSILLPSSDDVIIPIFTDTIDLNNFALLPHWQIFAHPIFKLNINEDSVSFDKLLNVSIRTVIDHHLKLSMSMEQFIMIQFRENGTVLNDENFFIDWKERKIILPSPDYTRTYKLIICINLNYINNLIKDHYIKD